MLANGTFVTAEPSGNVNPELANFILNFANAHVAKVSTSVYSVNYCWWGREKCQSLAPVKMEMSDIALEAVNKLAREDVLCKRQKYISWLLPLLRRNAKITFVRVLKVCLYLCWSALRDLWAINRVEQCFLTNTRKSNSLTKLPAKRGHRASGWNIDYLLCWAREKNASFVFLDSEVWAIPVWRFCDDVYRSLRKFT